MQNLSLTYDDITDALIAGLRTGRLSASRRPDGEIGFAPAGVTPANCAPLEPGAAIAELESSQMTSLPIVLN